MPASRSACWCSWRRSPTNGSSSKSPPRCRGAARRADPAGRAARPDGRRRAGAGRRAAARAASGARGRGKAARSRPVAVDDEESRRGPEKTAAAAATRTRKSPLAPGTHRIVMRTEGEAWLEVKDGAGRMLVSSLNPAGSERVVRGARRSHRHRQRELACACSTTASPWTSRRTPGSKSPASPLTHEPPMKRRISRQVAVGGVAHRRRRAGRRAVDDQHRHRRRARPPRARSRSSRAPARSWCASPSTRRRPRRRCRTSASSSTRIGCDVPLVGDFHYNGHKLLTPVPGLRAARSPSTASTRATSARAPSATSSSPDDRMRHALRQAGAHRRQLGQPRSRSCSRA